MTHRSKSNLPAPLARGRERFEKWRRKQKTRTRLPAPLWSAAVKLAQRHGVNRTARALHLSTSGLKKRMASTIDDAPVLAGDPPAFIQLLSSELTAVAECAIECQYPNGTAIRLHLKGPQLPDLAALIAGFRDIGR